MRRALFGMLLAACGGSAPPAPVPEVPPTPSPVRLAPVTDADVLATPRPARPAALPVDETARPPRIQHLATLRPALVRCGDRHDGLTPGFAACTCGVLCRARFPAEESTTTIRFPFIDVDGLVFTITPEGRVTDCAYSVSGRVLADVTCEP